MELELRRRTGDGLEKREELKLLKTFLGRGLAIEDREVVGVADADADDVLARDIAETGLESD